MSHKYKQRLCLAKHLLQFYKILENYRVQGYDKTQPMVRPSKFQHTEQLSIILTYMKSNICSSVTYESEHM